MASDLVALAERDPLAAAVELLVEDAARALWNASEASGTVATWDEMVGDTAEKRWCYQSRLDDVRNQARAALEATGVPLRVLAAFRFRALDMPAEPDAAAFLAALRRNPISS